MKLSTRSIAVILLSVVIAGSLAWVVLRSTPEKTRPVAKKPMARYPYANVPGVRKSPYKSTGKTMLRRLTDLPNMVNVDSDIIVIGSVKTILRTGIPESTESPGLAPPFTDYEFAVEDVLKGSSEPTITVRGPGVLVTETTQTYEGGFDGNAWAPYLFPGERVLLLLTESWLPNPAKVEAPPLLPNTFDVPNSSFIYRINGDIARRGYRAPSTPDLLQRFPFIERDEEMSLAALISRIKGYMTSGDTGYGPPSRTWHKPSWATTDTPTGDGVSQ